MLKNTRRLAFGVMLMAGLLIAFSAPANAATNQLSGTAFFNSSEGDPCPENPAYSSYDPIVMTGSLEGCWYTNIEASRTTDRKSVV